MLNPAAYESVKYLVNSNMIQHSAEVISKMSDDELRSFGSLAGTIIDPQELRAASASMARAEGLYSEIKSPKPADSKLSKVLEVKQKGAEQFRLGNLKEAGCLFEEGVRYIEEGISGINKNLEVTIRMNFITCLINEKRFEETIEQCEKTLALEENSKLFFRYAEALNGLGKYEKALECLRKAKELSPCDEKIASFFKEIEHRKENEKSRLGEIELGNLEEVDLNKQERVANEEEMQDGNLAESIQEVVISDEEGEGVFFSTEEYIENKKTTEENLPEKDENPSSCFEVVLDVAELIKRIVTSWQLNFFIVSVDMLVLAYMLSYF